MNLVNEAAYLYVYSKKVNSLSHKIRRYSKKLHKHRTKHDEAKNEKERHKHRGRHEDTAKYLEKLMKQHNKVLEKLQHHRAAFTHALHKEHKLN